MKPKFSSHILLLILSMTLVLSSCGTFAPSPTATNTAQPTATQTLVPTATLTPTRTPRPTATPNLAATQHIQDLQAEAQAYVEKGYLTSADGRFRDYEDFEVEWAQLNWYQWYPLTDTVTDFYLTAHVKWESAYRNADLSGCGFVFGLQPDSAHYAVFLDRTQVLFLISSETQTRDLGRTRGTGKVKFEMPAEADFTLIVRDHYAYVLVNDELIGEYSLSQSQPLRGRLALTVLSGTNKDYGTRCEMTNLHAWIPE